jgi:hypothetical protein
MTHRRKKIFDAVGRMVYLCFALVWIIKAPAAYMRWGGIIIAVAAIAAISLPFLGRLRYVHRAEFLLLNHHAIYWQIQGRSPVYVPWGDVHSVHYRRWNDSVVIRSEQRPRVRQVPARFRPREIRERDFGQAIEEHWRRYKDDCQEKPAQENGAAVLEEPS